MVGCRVMAVDWIIRWSIAGAVITRFVLTAEFLVGHGY